MTNDVRFLIFWKGGLKEDGFWQTVDALEREDKRGGKGREGGGRE